MGRQSILYTSFSRKTDLNRCLRLIFICPDGSNRLIRARGQSKIIKLVTELSNRMKIPEQDLFIVHQDTQINSFTKDGSLTTLSHYKLNDNDIINVYQLSNSPSTSFSSSESDAST